MAVLWHKSGVRFSKASLLTMVVISIKLLVTTELATIVAFGNFGCFFSLSSV